MRIALLSDVHGNAIALDAVLADLRLQEAVDEVWLLGDLAAIGYDPVGVLERLAALPNARFVRGNTEEYVTSGTLPPPTLADVQASPELLQGFAEMVRAFGWTQGAVTAAGWLDWLADLPLEQRTTLPDGTRLLGVHVSPGTTAGAGIRPSLSDDDLRSLLTGCEADLVCVGHTHCPLRVQVDGVDLVNVGGVSNPVLPDLLARYDLVDADQGGYRVQHRAVDYDQEAVIAAAYDVRYPGAEYVEKYIRVAFQSGWADARAAGEASPGAF
jgi:predicted phosphodiesterase